jgi:hypothetical protein
VRSLLVEASIVPIPANQKARIRSVKSLGVLGSLASVSGWLRDCGFTGSEIDIVVNKGKANARQESSRTSGEKARRNSAAPSAPQRGRHHRLDMIAATRRQQQYDQRHRSGAAYFGGVAPLPGSV